MENWKERFEYIYVIEENKGEKYLRKYDHTTIVEELEYFISQELDKAREEKIQNIFTKEEWGLMYESLIYRFGNDKEFKHLEQKILGMRKLSKLKQ